MTEEVILVDENDIQIGTMEKMEAHRKGLLHRAFSIFVFNSKNELLLQRRAVNKYHSGGLWTNTCCSHPRPGEVLLEAANRRLHEEMGLYCKLDSAFSFIYKTTFSNGLTEHEFDHVIIGKCDDIPMINKGEAEDYLYLSLDKIKEDMMIKPQNYTEWFKISFSRIEEYFNNEKL